MTKSSYARVMKKKSEKLRLKAKKDLLKEYPKLMEDEAERKKAFALIDSAGIAVDDQGNMRIVYPSENNENKELINLS